MKQPRMGEICEPLEEPRRVEILPAHEPIPEPAPAEPVKEPAHVGRH